jgi:Major Facilitator Superfamily
LDLVITRQILSDMRLPWSKKGPLSDEPSKGSDPYTDSNTTSSNEEPVSSSQPISTVTDEKSSGAINHDNEGQVESRENPTTDEKEQTVERTLSTATEDSSVGVPGEDDESQYPKAVQIYLLTFGLAMSTFVVALDNTIIATAIPRITTVFNSLDDVGWYGSAYLLTTTSLQPSFGKIYTYFNIKWTYIFAISIFEAGSVICAAAANSRMLIIGRAVAGIGAAAIFSGGMTIVGYSVPLRKRPIYIGLLSSMFGISSVVGPILGGALTDSKNYRSPSCPHLTLC